MDIDGYLRRKLLEDIYDKMSDEERKLFVKMTLQDKSHAEIMQALRQQSAQLDSLQQTQQGFAGTLASNIAGNAVFAGIVLLAKKLFK